MTEQRRTLAEMAARGAAETVLSDEVRSITWAELEDLTHRIGNGFAALGLKPQDHVALVCSNRLEFIVVVLAAQRGGYTMTPVKTNWTAEEIGYVLRDAGSRVVVTDSENGVAAARAHGLPVLELDDGFERWVESQDDAPLPTGLVGYRIPYTSGTTGRPKGVRRNLDATSPFETWWSNQALQAERLGLPRDGVHLMVAQLFHGAPMNFAVSAMANGAPMRIMDRWDAQRGLALMADGVTATCMVPTMFRQLLALPDDERARFDPSNLVRVLHGGESCSVELKQRMIDWWGPVFTEYYGFTEGGMSLCTTEQWLKRPGTVGTPAADMEMLVVGENGEPVGPNEEGTVYFRRPDGRDAFSYLGAEEKTREAFRDDGFFTVGDIGYVDEDGFLFLSGRSAELIINAGVNVYPAEIEAVIFEVEGVADAAVAGEPDAERGEHPVAFLSLAAGADADVVRAAVESACRERLAGYKRPRRLVIREEIPRDPTGKALRTLLRNELWGKA